MRTLVMKFGGSSVGTSTALTQVLSIVLHERDQWDQVALVVSALDGVTDALIEAAHLARLGNQRGYRRIVANLRTRHMALIDDLPLGTNERAALRADLDRLLFDMLDIYQTMGVPATSQDQAAAEDATIGVGERLSARIIAALLRQNDMRSVALDTTSLMITDDTFGNAIPNIALTRQQINTHLRPLLERGIVPVLTGFIGATASGKPTTLGRGGSDYTASIMGQCVEASEIWFYTDVDGMMTADPREIIDARVIPQLSYDEAAELAFFGARILHTRMIGPLRQERIPLRVKNVFRPQQPGTVITQTGSGHGRTIKAVTSITGLALTAEHSGPLSTVAMTVDRTLFNTTHSHAEAMFTSQSSARSFMCFLIPTSAGPDAIHATRTALEEDLASAPETQSWKVTQVSIITFISDPTADWPRIMAAVPDALGDIPALALARGPSGCSMSVVVALRDTETALQRGHQLVINSD